MTFVPWRDRRELAKDLKAMYTADSEKTAEEALTAFEDNYQKNYPTVAQIWRRNWLNIIPIFDYPADIRKAIYTTIVIESLIYSLKEPLKTRGAFPTEDSLMKVLYLAINKASTKRAMPIHNWMQVLNWFAQLFDDSLLDGLDTQNR